MKDKGITAHALNISRRHLPHWQIGGSWYFVTFRTKNIVLSAEARALTGETIASSHGVEYGLSIAVVMPDHVHILFKPLVKSGTQWYPLSGILRRIKGTSAIKANRAMKRIGPLWIGESFDRIVRDADEWGEKYGYVRNNAVKAGLAETPEDYPWPQSSLLTTLVLFASWQTRAIGTGRFY